MAAMVEEAGAELSTPVLEPASADLSAPALAELSAPVRGGEVHVGRNIEALQRELGVSDEALVARLGLSHNRFWDMKRRDWAQKKTVALVAAALSEASGTAVSAENVLTGRLDAEAFASRAVEAFVRRAEQLSRPEGRSLGGIRLPRLHLGALPAGPVTGFETGDAQQVVRADPGDFVITADGDCMLPTLCDGDELVCVFAETAADGDVVVASYGDEAGEWQSGIKRLVHNGEGAILRCDNQSADPLGRRLYPDIRPRDLRIHGVVVGLWRPVRR
jgi:hypothetical protein